MLSLASWHPWTGMCCMCAVLELFGTLNYESVVWDANNIKDAKSLETFHCVFISVYVPLHLFSSPLSFSLSLSFSLPLVVLHWVHVCCRVIFNRGIPSNGLVIDRRELDLVSCGCQDNRWLSVKPCLNQPRARREKCVVTHDLLT